MNALIDQCSMNDAELAELQRCTFGYFLHEANPANGLVPDSTKEDSPASTAAVGLALMCYPIGVEREFLPREDAVERTLATLQFLFASEQSPDPQATGYKGFYYHFLDMKTGRRHGEAELSTIDTTFLIAGVLTAATYFDADDEKEREVRRLADLLYRRVDWQWATDGGPTVTHGWKPDDGFIESRWEGYSEALILYVLGLASPTHPLPPSSYAAWTASYRWREVHEVEYLYGGPLFVHQLSHCWVDFRGIQDAYMRKAGLDYFENSRRATYVQRAYAKRNPRGFAGYCEHAWGVTASDGPGPKKLCLDGVEREFFEYQARGVPDGPDDGTLAPWAVVASLPFAPEIVLPALRHFDQHYPQMTSKYGFKCSYNPTFTEGGRRIGLGLAGLLRARPGAGRGDDRQLPHRVPLAADARLPRSPPRPAPRRLRRRMAGEQLGLVRQPQLPPALADLC